MISDCQGSTNSERPLMRRETVETYPPFLERPFVVWQGFQAGLGIRARFGLGCRGEQCGFIARSRTIARSMWRRGRGFENKADNGRFPDPFVRVLSGSVLRGPSSYAVVQVTLPENDSLFKPVVQVVPRAFCNLQA